MVSKKVTKEISKAEDKPLRNYELVFIISPEVSEERADAIVDDVSQFVTARGATISEVERWGKRKLAYPIRHFTEGNYVLARFKMKSALGKEIEANLRISEEILRHLLIKLES